MKNSAVRFQGVLRALVLWLCCAVASAQTPSAEQWQLLNQLPPDQRQALLDQYGQGGMADAPLATPEVSQPKTAPVADDSRAVPGDTVLLSLSTTTDEDPVAAELVARALAANPHRLDGGGYLRIPGLGAPIMLAGLTTAEAIQRLQGEPALRNIRVGLSLLRPRAVGVDALRPFGYDIFRNGPSTFAQASDIPVPPDYTIGPGDSVEIQFLGNVKGLYTLTVARDGTIRLPEIGAVAVAGMRFSELEDMLTATVGEQMIGTRVTVGMGRLRSLQVMVTGDAENPGAYTVGGLSTVSNVLVAAGGVRAIGSLRRVRLLRGGEVVSTLDLYDLLLRGDSRADVRIQSGDVIFVPPLGQTAGVTGEIRRPAIYEFRGAATAGDLVALAGGLNEAAASTHATLERIEAGRGRVVIDVDLATPAGRATRLRRGDILHIPPVRTTLNDSITLAGHVHHPGATQFRAGMRLTDVLPTIEDLKPGADTHYVLIRRELPLDRRIELRSADLAAAWQARGGDADVPLTPRDHLVVFDLGGGREPLLRPLIEDFRRQSTLDAPAGTVTVGGSVRMPGEYPLEPGMTVRDLVRAGASLAEAAFGAEAELARYEVIDGESRRTRVETLDLAAALAGDAAANLTLQPFDILTIRRVPQWTDQEFVTLAGEVRFPGRYPVRRGETLAALIVRAGGLTDQAFADGAVFTREALREREAQQVRALADRLEKDLALLAVQASQTSQDAQGLPSLAAGQSLLGELRNAQPVGRLAIDLPRLLRGGPGGGADIVLRGDDRLLVPRRSQEVTVLGEVQTTTSHLYQAGLTRDDYLGLSGGLTQKADGRRIYVVRANGQVAAAAGSRWLPRRGIDIRPGDTIIVPVDAERLPPLPLWTSVTSIIYNLAVAVAAVNSF